MMKSAKRVILVLFLGLCVPATLFAQTLSDTEKERRWMVQIVDTLFDGETIWLEADGHDFLGIEMTSPNYDERKNASPSSNQLDEAGLIDLADKYREQYEFCSDRFGKDVISSLWRFAP